MKKHDGCETTGMCISNQHTDSFGFPCPAICQPHCSSREKLCPGVKDKRGCASVGVCTKSETTGIHEDLCPPTCSITCSETQLKCPGLPDFNGCKNEDYCVENGVLISKFFSIMMNRTINHYTMIH